IRDDLVTGVQTCALPICRYDAMLDLLAGDATLSHLDAERMEFAMTHAEVGAAALSVMRFPADVVEAIGSHHTPPAEVTSQLGREIGRASCRGRVWEHVAG